MVVLPDQNLWWRDEHNYEPDLLSRCITAVIVLYLALTITRDDDIAESSNFENTVLVLVQLFEDGGLFNVPNDYVATGSAGVEFVAQDCNAANVALIGVQNTEGFQILLVPDLLVVK